jgi:hypothetical protein
MELPKPMAASSSKSTREVPLTAAQQKRIHASAQALIGQAIDLLAADVPITPETLTSAGIPNPVTAGKSMLDAQKFRLNWYQIERCHLNRIARLLVERNWFAAPVHEANKAIWGAGFHFKGKDAREWVKQSSYPFAKLHSDMLEEYLVNSAVCVFWRKNPEPGTLPMIEVPDIENVKYETIGGVPQITIGVPSNRKIDPRLEPSLGKRMYDCVKQGKKLVIIKGLDEDYDFEILKKGKSTACIAPPKITGIIDDLDFIEAVRCGDWNGAWSRREILRISKKGSGVSSGPNAGTARNNAKFKEIQEILKTMKSIIGKTDVAMNWDQEASWLTFGKEFFDPAIVDTAVRRLVFWGGLPAVLMLKTDSQMDGMASYVREIARAQVLAFRSEFATFLSSVFNSDSFRINFPSAPDLECGWSVKSLYGADALNKLATTLHTNGIAATPTIRALYDIDDEEEGTTMEKTHESPKKYTPVFESRQGIAASFTAPESSPGSAPSAAEDSPGRPSANET